ncbi:MAG TPA: ABC transporter permease [Actinopolymorphaceae bacterium]
MSAPTGVIHDIGYRGYDGARLGRSAIWRSLFVQSLRSTYGLGRTAKSKALPFLLLGCMILPAVVIAAVVIFARQMSQEAGFEAAFSTLPIHYTGYPIVTQAAIGIYLASQAPQLFSRDLRFRTITLYFSRPLTRLDYVTAKYAALVGGLMILVGVPLLLLYAGGLLAGFPIWRETTGLLEGLVGALILALLLAGMAALVSSLTVRRGFAVAAIITIGMVSFGLSGAVTGIGFALGNDALVGAAGLLSPVTLLDGVQLVLFDQSVGLAEFPEEDLGWALFYLGTTLLSIVGAFALLVQRYRKVSGA